MKLRTLSFLLAFALPPVGVGCGPKKPVETDGVVNPKQLFVEGVQLLKTPGKDGKIDYAGAYAKFSAASTAQADFAKAHFNAGWASEQLGNAQQAVGHYQAALATNPGYVEAMYALGDVLSRTGKAPEAVALYKGHVEKNPEDLKGRNALMEALTAGDYYDEAIAQAKEILMRDARNVGAYRNLSRLYFAKGEYKMSQLCAEKAKDLAKGDSGIYNNIGVTFLVMKDDASAIDEFKTAIQLQPQSLEANLNLGYTALNSGDYNLAQQCFTAALEGTPGSIEARLGLAVALRGLKDYEQSGKLYDEVIAADPGNQKAYLNAATLYEKYVKDYKKAEKLLQTFISVNNKDGSIGPDHIVHARIARIKESQAIDEARKREEERKKKEAEEREKRQKEKLTELKTKVAALEAALQKYSSCEAFMMGVGSEAAMVVEQGKMVVEAGELDMAADVLTFVEQIQPMVDEAIPMCGAGGEAPAPAPAPAPAEGGGEAPPAEPPAPPAEPPAG